jgi:hypothetical protein
LSATFGFFAVDISQEMAEIKWEMMNLFISPFYTSKRFRFTCSVQIKTGLAAPLPGLAINTFDNQQLAIVDASQGSSVVPPQSRARQRPEKGFGLPDGFTFCVENFAIS